MKYCTGEQGVIVREKEILRLIPRLLPWAQLGISHTEMGKKTKVVETEAMKALSWVIWLPAY